MKFGQFMSYYKREKFIKKFYKKCDPKTSSRLFCVCKKLTISAIRKWNFWGRYQQSYQNLSKSFDIIAVSETIISKKTSLTCNINLKNYSFELTPTESSAGGTLLYISNRLSYKPRFDLNILKTFKLNPRSLKWLTLERPTLLLAVFINILIWML